MTRNYKKLRECDHFFLSDDGYLFEERNHIVDGKKEVVYRQLQPSVLSRFWEVYVLFNQRCMAYVVVGLHQGKRVVYEQDMQFVTRGLFFLPVGRYLANAMYDENRWRIQSAEDGRLVDMTDVLTDEPDLFCVVIKSLSYTSPVLSLTVQLNQFHSKKSFWLLDCDGCRQIKENEVPSLIEKYGEAEDDPLYE